MRLIDADVLPEISLFGTTEYINVIKAPTVDAIPREKIKLLGEEHRKFREGITDEKVLIGFNMAIAICNKYFKAESEDK